MGQAKKIILIVIGVFLALALASWFLFSGVRSRAADSYITKGDEQLKQGNFEQAVLEYKKSSILYSKPQAFYRIGEIYFLDYKIDEAEKNFKTAIELDKNFTNGYLGLSQVDLRNQKLDDALQQAKKAENIDSKNIMTKIQVAKVYLAQQDENKANQEINNSSDQIALYYLSILDLAQGKIDEAKSALTELHTKDHKPGIIDELIFKSDASTSDIQKIEGVSISISKTSQENSRLVILAEALNQTGDQDIAIPILQKIAGKQKNYRDAHLFLGHSYMLNRDWNRAKDELITAKNIDPTYGLTWNWLSTVYENLGEKDAAKDAKERWEKLKS